MLVFVGEHSWLLFAVNVVLFCCCFVLAPCLDHLKGICMTKLMKVCVGNNHRIDSWNVQALKLWTRIRKHWYLCSDVGITKKKQTLRNYSIVFVFKSSIRVVALSSLYSKFRFSPVPPDYSDHWRSFQNYNWQQNAKVWKSNTSSTFVYL